MKKGFSTTRSGQKFLPTLDDVSKLPFNYFKYDNVD